VIEADAFNGHAWHTLGGLDQEQGRLDSAAKAYSNGQLSGGARKPSTLLCYEIFCMYICMARACALCRTNPMRS
jgi:hypothetical protein